MTLFYIVFGGGQKASVAPSERELFASGDRFL